MNIDIIFKIAGIGVLTAVINQILKLSGKVEIATFVTLAGIIIVLFSVINKVFIPIRAEARHASAPAWPPPTTMTSYIFCFASFLLHIN